MLRIFTGEFPDGITLIDHLNLFLSNIDFGESISSGLSETFSLIIQL